MRLIFQNRNFAPLFWTQFLGALNDNFFKNALALMITYQGVTLGDLGPKSLVPLAGGVFILPFLLFSAFSGQLADRFEKTFLIRIAKVSELLIMSLAGVGFLLDSFSLLMVVLFFMGAQSAFFGPLKYGIIPSLLSPLELVRGNAFVGSGTFVAILLGTILGGVVVSTEDSSSLASTGVFAVSFIGLLTAFLMRKTSQYDPEVKLDKNIFRPAWQIVKETKREPELLRLILGISWFWFLGACILSLLPPMAKEVLYADEGVGTLFLAIFTVGMGGGSYLTAKVSQVKTEIGLIAPAAFFFSCFLGDLGHQLMNWDYHPLTLFTLSDFFQLEGSYRMAFDLLFVSIFGGMFIIPQMTYLQERAPINKLSRYLACNNIFNSFFMVAAAVVIMGLHSLNFSIPSIFLMIALLSLIVSFIVYFYYMEVTIRFCAWCLASIFMKLDVKGKSHFPQKGPMIIASNHVSYLDWLVILAVSPHPVRFIIDSRFYRIPTAKFWFSQARLIPIATRKECEQTLKEAFDMIYESLDYGAVVGIFPEGWITRDGNVRKLQPGLNKMLKERPVPVVPVCLKGLWGGLFSYSGGKVLFKKPKAFRPKVTAIVGEVIQPEDYDSKELRAWFEEHSHGSRE